MSEIMCTQAGLGTATGTPLNKELPLKRVPTVGIEAPNGDRYVFPFDCTDQARKVCRDILSLCDRLDSEENCMSKRKPFVLGKDVAMALMEIVSINDDLPDEYRQKMEQAKEAKQ